MNPQDPNDHFQYCDGRLYFCFLLQAMSLVWTGRWSQSEIWLLRGGGAEARRQMAGGGGCSGGGAEARRQMAGDGRVVLIGIGRSERGSRFLQQR